MLTCFLDLKLVGMGTFMSPDTTRIVAKRILLTGHPFKVHKKTATMRYMFFNAGEFPSLLLSLHTVLTCAADDIAYFKPIALTTKHGRTGHIKESLGTHGYFKAHFDGPINQMDTVCMSLYKRMFPRWSTLFQDPKMVDPSSSNGVGEDKMEE